MAIHTELPGPCTDVHFRAFQEPLCGSNIVDHYHIWCNLRPGTKDLDFSGAIHAMLGHMKEEGLVEDYRLLRRKLGFGPESLGEFHVDIMTANLAQLDEAFHRVTPRSGHMEKLHAAVWSKVVDFKSALYRDFPDPNRS